MADGVLFDINETTLDLSPLGPRFEAVFGNPRALDAWFARVLHASTVCALTGTAAGFRELASAGLDRAAVVFGIDLGAEDRRALLEAVARLPPHPDVAPALDRFRRHGFRTAAFSNSSRELLSAQVDQAGLSDGFDAVISVEEVRSFKPHEKVYLHAVERMACPRERVWLIAAHDWDVHGALCAGLSGAYLARTGAPYHPAFRRPTVEATTMHELVTAVLAASQS